MGQCRSVEVAIKALSESYPDCIFISQIIFAAAFAGVVATQLDYQQVKAGAPTVCLLNSKGQDCV